VLAVELAVTGLVAATSADVIRALASRLLARGHVKASFERAALVREKRSPTGLPFEPWPIALPHAEPEHVVTPGIAIATLAAPVAFRQMGTPGTSLAVSIVIMPAFTEKDQAAASLSRLITMMQDQDTRDRLVQAADAEELRSVLAPRWGAP
jgi:PTS system galactitol-specific IIA component